MKQLNLAERHKLWVYKKLIQTVPIWAVAWNNSILLNDTDCGSTILTENKTSAQDY